MRLRGQLSWQSMEPEMSDTLSPLARSERMSRIRAKNTAPELQVRKLLHALGFRYRLHRSELPGKPDLAFPNRRKVIFVHGCFWHRHPDSACPLARLPKSRLEFWLPKLEGNARRDQENGQKLDALGWKSLTIWECQLRDKEALRDMLLGFLCHEID